MKCQKNLDARWAKKHGEGYYGYKNHINIAKKDKLLRHYKVSEGSVHVSQLFDDVLDEENSGV